MNKMRQTIHNRNSSSRVYFASIVLLISTLVSSCAIQLEKPIDEKIENIPPVSQVRAKPESFQNNRIRWGGVIASTINEKQTTLVEVVSRPLSSQGRPVDSDDTEGRFLARISGFLDPVIFASGREITVVGSISGLEKRLINEFEYSYPLVSVDNFKLWQPVDERPIYYYDPYWFGPWYPYYGRHYNPYWYKKPAVK